MKVFSHPLLSSLRCVCECLRLYVLMCFLVLAGRTLRRETALEEAGASVRELNVEQRDIALDGRLVHATARAEATEPLEDADLGLVADFAVPALKLTRYCARFSLLHSFTCAHTLSACTAINFG
jgi:hypothetical protein